MKKHLASVMLALSLCCWMPAAAGTLSPAAAPKAPKAVSPPTPLPARQAPTPPPPANLSLLNITAPNGGEKWIVGSTQNITWTTNLNGNCMVELYRGTSPQTRVGTIASGTLISNKVMPWKVGSYDGGTGTAPPGNDYWVVIKSEALAKADASNGPFTLMAITASPSAAAPIVRTEKMVTAAKKKELSASFTEMKKSFPFFLKVSNPETGNRAIGDTIPVEWTSAVSCSGNGGPFDAAFRIELMNAEGTAKIQDLTDVGYIGDSEDPTGYVNWHWDWKVVRGSCNPGTYKIKVTSMISSATCYDTSPPFSIFDPTPGGVEPPKPLTELLTAQITNKKRCTAERYDDTDEQPDPQLCQFPDIPPGQGKVGSFSTYRDLGGLFGGNWHESSYTHFRSKLYFDDPFKSSNQTGYNLKHANLQIKVKNQQNNARPGSAPVKFCAHYLYVLAGPWNECMNPPLFLGFEGISVPYDRDTINIDVTAIVKLWMNGGLPNNGLLLTDYPILPNADNICVSHFTATLWMEFEEVTR